MKTREDILFDVKWPLYALEIGILVVPSVCWIIFLLSHFDQAADNWWLLLLTLVPFALLLTSILRLIVLPYYYLWAFEKVDDARWLQSEMVFNLPFYPKPKWYVGLIPFYGKYKPKFEAIAERIEDKEGLNGLDLSMYETTEAIVAQKKWIYPVLYFLVVLVLISSVVLLVLIDSKTISGNFILINSFLLFGWPLIRLARYSKRIVIDNKSITVGAVSYPWSRINAIYYNRPTSFVGDLIIITNDNEQITIPVEDFTIKGTHLHGYALFYQRQYLQSLAS